MLKMFSEKNGCQRDFRSFLDYSTAKDVQGKPFPEKLNEIWYLTPFKVQNFRILYHYSKKDLVKTLKDRIGLTLEQMQEKSIQFEKKTHKTTLAFSKKSPFLEYSLVPSINIE